MNELWAHQKLGFELAKDRPHFAFLFEVGTGKTRTAIEVLRYKFNVHHSLLKTIILGPPIILENWREEILKYSKINPKDITVLSGSGKERLEKLKKYGFSKDPNFKELPKAHIFITNYETLSMKSVFEALKEWSPEIVIADEMHKLKNGKSQRSKLTTILGDMSLYRLGLTGTSILNSPMDLFAQWRFLDKGESFTKNFFVFRSRFFYDKNANMPAHIHFPDWRILPSSEAIISDILSRTSLQAAKKDCLDLPPLIKKVYYTELSKEQEKCYKEMRDSFITFVKDSKCTAELAITKGLRLQQIVTGFIKLENGEEVEFKDNPRKDALKIVLEEITSTNAKVIVWAVFKKNYEAIRNVCEDLGLKYVELTGETKEKDRNANVKEFNDMTNDTLVCIANQGSGGVGINLIGASYMIYYSRNFNLEFDIQSEGRNYRGGSEIHEKITRIDLVTKGTMDEKVLEALKNKKDVSKRIIEMTKGGLL